MVKNMQAEITKNDGKVIEDELYKKFPVILKSKLCNGEISFPKGTQYEYEAFNAYRCVVRAKDDISPVNRQDMRSHPELGKHPKGVSPLDPDWYSTSLNTNLEELKQLMHFPKPSKKIASGSVYQEGGPHYIKPGGTHVSWWVYEDLDVSGFVIIED